MIYPRSSLIKLPIDGILPELLDHLEKNRSAILHASPGSGKTTRVPPALLRSSFIREDQEVWVLEPRRLAAKYAAHRVAQEWGEPVGKTIGYHFRFEKIAGPSTRLHFLTEGMLIRKLIADPHLEHVAAVILDEFHERHLHGDIALAYLARLQASVRPDLRIIVMSATLDSEKVSEFLGNAQIFKVEAPVFPIQIQTLPSPPSKSLEITVREAVVRALREETEKYPGDILIFLPGMAEIRRVQSELQNWIQEKALIFSLHGDLSREEQDRAVSPIPGCKKIILSTNVAETSLTLENLTTVIDSGLHRIASFSWWSGVPSLRTRPISRASAIQRAGRAGRTAPGRCYRLYTQGDFTERPAFETPEIQRADLCQSVLELKSLGMDDLENFAWFEAPSPRALQSAQELLFRLGAMDRNSGSSSLTAIGKRMVQAPAHPRISRMLIEAQKLGIADRAATLAAFIHEGQIDRGGSESISDPIEWIDRSHQDSQILRTKSQFLDFIHSHSNLTAPTQNSMKSAVDALRFALLTGFPDRVARKRSLSTSVSRGTGRDGSRMSELVFSSGGSALVQEAGVVTESDSFVTLDIQEQQKSHQARSQLKVRALSPIQPEWLFDLEPSILEEKTESSWDSIRGRIKNVSKMTYGELILLEEETGSVDPQTASEILLKSVFGINPLRLQEMQPEEWIQSLGSFVGIEIIESLVTRISLAAQYAPHLFSAQVQPPNSWKTALPSIVLQLLEGKTRLEELKDIDWKTGILFEFFQENLMKFETLLPTEIQLTPKRRARIHYSLEQAPWIESRLQDFFGMKQGPALLQGKLPITLHLLAPNQRAVQVTTDLSGFWERTYPELRNALSRRYPRHSWPENPLQPQNAIEEKLRR